VSAPEIVEEFVVDADSLREKLMKMGVKSIVIAKNDEIKYKYPQDFNAEELVYKVKTLFYLLGQENQSFFVKPSNEVIFVFRADDALVIFAGDLDEKFEEEYSLVAGLLLSEIA
jgi:hypothetical protein